MGICCDAKTPLGEMKSQIAQAKCGLPGLDRICAASQADCFKNSKEEY
jgi:hypothetical protein